MSRNSPAVRAIASIMMTIMPQMGMLHLLFKNLSFGLDMSPTTLKVRR